MWEAENMKLRDLAIGAAIGFACGYMAKSIINDYQMQSPDDILTAVIIANNPLIIRFAFFTIFFTPNFK